MTTKKVEFKDLLIDHDYYCSRSNYDSPDAAQEYENWEDFYSEYKEADIDLNLVFRWDVYQNENEDGEILDTYYMSISMMKQRKGIFTPIIINKVEEKNIDEIKAFLTLQYEHLKKLWSPFSYKESWEIQ